MGIGRRPHGHRTQRVSSAIGPYLAYVGIGSNLDAEDQVARAVALLARRVPIQKISTFYRSPPADGVAAPWFCNGVVAVQTRIPAAWFVAGILKPLERRLGRDRIAPSTARVAIDLDLLLTTTAPPAAVRHDHAHHTIRDRPYVAIPLHEVAGDLRFPGWDQTLAEIVVRLQPAEMTSLDRLTHRLRRDHLRTHEVAQ